MYKIIISFFIVCGLSFNLHAQKIEINGSRKAVRTSGEIGTILLPMAELTAIFIQNDWKGMKQGILSGATAMGTTYILKQIVKKERPNHADFHSFPSMHSTISFSSAAFIQRRYGWKWGIPAYVLSTYVAWSRVYAKEHDGWDVLTGAVIGAGTSYIFTRPFAKKHQLTLSPIASDKHYGLYASLHF